MLLMFTAPEAKFTAPAPVMSEPAPSVRAALRCSNAPLATSMPPLSVPLAALNCSVPDVMFTCPLLTNGTETLCAAAPLLVKVPALLKLPTLLIGLPSVVVRFHCLPAWLFTTALLNIVSRLDPPWFTVPPLFQVRVSRLTKPVMLVVPLVVNAPGPPAMLPPLQVVDPVTSIAPLPPSVPLEIASVLPRLVAPLKLAIPPAIVTAADVVVAPPTVSAPPETVNGAVSDTFPARFNAPPDTTMFSLLMICAATRPASVTITIGLKVGRLMKTRSVTSGTPLLQLAATFQFSVTFESFTQTLTFWNALPRCRKTLPPKAAIT